MRYDLLLKGGMLIDSTRGMPDQIGTLKKGAVGNALAVAVHAS